MPSGTLTPQKVRSSPRRPNLFLYNIMLVLSHDFLSGLSPRSFNTKPCKGKMFPLQARLWPRRCVEVYLYSSMTTALEGGEWSAAHPGPTLPPGKTRYLLYRGLGGPQGRPRWAENLACTGIRSPDRPARSSVAIPTELHGPLPNLVH